MNVFGWFKSAGARTLTVVEKIPEAVVVIGKVLFTGEQVAPEVKTAVTNILSTCETGSIAILAAVAAKGANWAEDTAALAAAVSIAKTFEAEWPVAIDVFEKLDADVKSVVTPIA